MRTDQQSRLLDTLVLQDEHPGRRLVRRRQRKGDGKKGRRGREQERLFSHVECTRPPLPGIRKRNLDIERAVHDPDDTGLVGARARCDLVDRGGTALDSAGPEALAKPGVTARGRRGRSRRTPASRRVRPPGRASVKSATAAAAATTAARPRRRPGRPPSRRSACFRATPARTPSRIRDTSCADTASGATAEPAKSRAGSLAIDAARQASHSARCSRTQRRSAAGAPRPRSGQSGTGPRRRAGSWLLSAPAEVPGRAGRSRGAGSGGR